VNSDFVRNVAVSQPSGLGGVNRNAPNDVYGAAITGHQSPENSYLIDGPSVNNPACGVNGSPLTVVLIDEVSITAGGYMPEHGRSLDGALSATSTTPGTWGDAGYLTGDPSQGICLSTKPFPGLKRLPGDSGDGGIAAGVPRFFFRPEQ